KPSEVVLLEYHLHIPGPDPLTNAHCEARQNYYGDAVEGTPTIMFNGKAEAQGGGRASDAPKKYKEYRQVIEPLLEAAAKAKLKASTVRKGDKIDISVEVADLEKAGEKVRLRLALVEEVVRYPGGNQMRFHHRVVRSLPGGAKGIALPEKTGKHSV